jgi:hypothetical protein
MTRHAELGLGIIHSVCFSSLNYYQSIRQAICCLYFFASFIVITYISVKHSVVSSVFHEVCFVKINISILALNYFFRQQICLQSLGGQNDKVKLMLYQICL